MLDLSLLDPNLIMINIEANTKDEAITQIARKLISQNYVKESYLQAVLERERVFPTGLPTEGYGIAIPHTDIEHVNKPAIALGILKEPVGFNIMGDTDPDSMVDVKILFVLAIKEPHIQLQLLKDIMEIIQDSDLLDRMVKATNVESLVRLAEQYINERGVC